MAQSSGASTTVQKIAAEVLGTFVLVFFGCGSVIYAGSDGASIVSVGLTFGLAVMVMAYAVGRISGAHFNPAVTVGAALSGRMSWKQVPTYVGSQVGGAILGALALFVLLQGFDTFDASDNMGQNGFGDDASGYAWWAAFLLELLLTAVFVFVILAVTDERNEHPAFAPLVIGLTLAAIHFVAIPATGTSVNPARSIGPALFAGGHWIVQLWLFILAPLAGAAIAGFAYPKVFGHGSEPVPGSGLTFSRPRAAAAVPGYGAPDQFQQEWNQQTLPQGATDATATQQVPQQGDPAWPAEPIIQDGWQWDHAAQEWKPLEQWTPPAQQQPVDTTSTQASEPVQPVQPGPLDDAAPSSDDPFRPPS